MVPGTSKPGISKLLKRVEVRSFVSFCSKSRNCLAVTLISLVLVFSFFPGSGFKSSAAPYVQTRPQLKLALLVGINKYKDPLWPTLRGSENDLRMVRELLEDPKFGFKEELDPEKKGDCGRQKSESPIWTLCSEQATRKAILDAFDQHLIAAAKKFAVENRLRPADGAEVVFSYSGHGSFVKDVDGDETDGVDETIVPYDAMGRTEGQILDDEIKARLDELKKYTTNITVISDSCYSGSISRGYPSRGGSNELNKDAGVNRVIRDGLDDPEDVVTISASLPNQFARELYYPDADSGNEVVHGALTYNLVSLIKQHPGSTYREIVNLVRNALDAQGVGQTPTAEGAIDRVVFSSRTKRRTAPIFPVCETEKGQNVCSRLLRRPAGRQGSDKKLIEVTLPVGEIVGAGVGGPVAVFAPGVTDLAGDDGLIGTGRITASSAFKSNAVVSLLNEARGSITANAQFVLVSPFFVSEKNRVAVDLPSGTVRSAAESGPGTSLLAEIAEKLKGNAYVNAFTRHGILEGIKSSELSSQKTYIRGTDWNLAIVSSTYKEYGELSGDTIEGKDPGGKVLFIVDRNGTPIYHFNVSVKDPEAASKVIRALELNTRVADIRALSNEASPISGKVLLKYVPVDRNSKPDELCNLSLKAGDLSRAKTSHPALKAGDKFYFEIVNASPKKLYMYLISIGADGGISFFYPPKGASELLPVGAVFRTCESDLGLFEVVEDSVTGPETVKMIVTTTPIQAEILESPKIATQKRGAFSPLDALLSRVALNARGAPDSELSIDDWATVDFDYEVVR